MHDNLQSCARARANRGYALGWAALLCVYCVPYSAPAQSQDTHATQALDTVQSTQLGSAAGPSTESGSNRSADSASVHSDGNKAASTPPPAAPMRSGEGTRADASSTEWGTDANAAASSRGAESAVRAGPGVVNINSAGAVELERLPRVGPARAQAILALRSKLRQFSRVEQLLQVKGIGRATFRMLRPLLALSGPTTLEHKRGR